MHTLRTSAMLARLVLAWFVLTLSVAAASPLVHPRSMQMVCSAQGTMTLVAMDDDGSASSAYHHTLDCPMCLAASMPPPSQRAIVEMPQPLAHALQPIEAAHIAALVGAPLPARGPPPLAS